MLGDEQTVRFFCRGSSRDGKLPIQLGFLVGLQEIISGYSCFRANRPQRRSLQFGVIRHGQGRARAIGVPTNHRNVLFLPDDPKAEQIQGSENSLLRRIDKT
jgi:hypothetical protein